MAMLPVSEFDWDEANWPKCGKHGVGRDEIESIFSRGVSVAPAPERATGEARYIAIGMNEADRAVLVVFTLRERQGRHMLRPISARYLHDKELRHHERQTAGS